MAHYFGVGASASTIGGTDLSPAATATAAAEQESWWRRALLACDVLAPAAADCPAAAAAPPPPSSFYGLRHQLPPQQPQPQQPLQRGRRVAWGGLVAAAIPILIAVYAAALAREATETHESGVTRVVQLAAAPPSQLLIDWNWDVVDPVAGVTPLEVERGATGSTPCEVALARVSTPVALDGRSAQVCPAAASSATPWASLPARGGSPALGFQFALQAAYAPTFTLGAAAAQIGLPGAASVSVGAVVGNTTYLGGRFAFTSAGQPLVAGLAALEDVDAGVTAPGGGWPADRVAAVEALAAMPGGGIIAAVETHDAPGVLGLWYQLPSSAWQTAPHPSAIFANVSALAATDDGTVWVAGTAATTPAAWRLFACSAPAGAGMACTEAGDPRTSSGTQATLRALHVPPAEEMLWVGGNAAAMFTTALPLRAAHLVPPTASAGAVYQPAAAITTANSAVGAAAWSLGSVAVVADGRVCAVAALQAAAAGGATTALLCGTDAGNLTTVELAPHGAAHLSGVVGAPAAPGITTLTPDTSLCVWGAALDTTVDGAGGGSFLCRNATTAVWDTPCDTAACGMVTPATTVQVEAWGNGHLLAHVSTASPGDPVLMLAYAHTATSVPQPAPSLFTQGTAAAVNIVGAAAAGVRTVAVLPGGRACAVTDWYAPLEAAVACWNTPDDFVNALQAHQFVASNGDGTPPTIAGVLPTPAAIGDGVCLVGGFDRITVTGWGVLPADGVACWDIAGAAQVVVPPLPGVAAHGAALTAAFLSADAASLCVSGVFSDASTPLGGSSGTTCWTPGDADWTPVGGLVNGVITGGATLPSGTLLLGNFTMTDPVEAAALTRFNSRNRTWAPVTNGFDTADANATASATWGVHALASAPDGTLTVGGEFAVATSGGGGGSVYGLAVYDAAASTWSSVGGVARPSSIVTALAWGGADGDTLFAAGTYDSLGGVAAPGLARWDGITWRPVLEVPGAGVVTTLMVLSPQAGGAVLGGAARGAAGLPRLADGTVVNGLVAVSPAGRASPVGLQLARASWASTSGAASAWVARVWLGSRGAGVPLTLRVGDVLPTSVGAASRYGWQQHAFQLNSVVSPSGDRASDIIPLGATAGAAFMSGLGGVDGAFPACAPGVLGWASATNASNTCCVPNVAQFPAQCRAAASGSLALVGATLYMREGATWVGRSASTAAGFLLDPAALAYERVVYTEVLSPLAQLGMCAGAAAIIVLLAVLVRRVVVPFLLTCVTTPFSTTSDTTSTPIPHDVTRVRSASSLGAGAGAGATRRSPVGDGSEFTGVNVMANTARGPKPSIAAPASPSAASLLPGRRFSSAGGAIVGDRRSSPAAPPSTNAASVAAAVNAAIAIAAAEAASRGAATDALPGQATPPPPGSPRMAPVLVGVTAHHTHLTPEHGISALTPGRSPAAGVPAAV